MPLKAKANIVCDNALRRDWQTVLPAEKCSFVMGNPPFIGAKFMSNEQRADIEPIFKPLKNGGLLDYVAAWYVKAAHYVQSNNAIPVAFVSTNSITQGEQVSALWSWMLNHQIKINFAHRTFRWNNEGRGVAAVHCVIVGFGLNEPKQRLIYDYSDIGGEPEAIKAKNINPYLVDAPDVMLERKSSPISAVPEMKSGNKPIDNGNYLFTPEQKAVFLAKEPQAAKWFHRWLGGDEFLNSIERWYLWLGDCAEVELRKMPEAMKRVEEVRQFRLASKSAPTQKLAATPTRFHTECMPKGEYITLPQVSSERRAFIPIDFLSNDVLCGDKLRIVDNATLYHLGVLTSTMHNAWMRAVCGRLESRYQYSALIVYNNFPWPDSSEELQKSVSEKAQAILDARAVHEDKSLAWLYNPETMPDNLNNAHAQLDKAVDAAYGYKSGKDDTARVAFLFERYQKIINDK